MKTNIKTLWWRLGLFCLLTFPIVSKGQVAPPVRHVLYTNIGDGFAQFETDEFGDFRGCGNQGIRFDPLGAFGSKQADCHSTMYIFNAARNRRSVVANGDWSYYGPCGATEQIPNSTHVLSDVTVGTHTRISTFILPEFPELAFQLTQVACGNKLVQTYAVTNLGGIDIDLLFDRTGDLDLEFTDNFNKNYGGEYPLGTLSPIGGIILDRSGDYGIAFTSPASSDAVFDGWRVQVGGAGSFVHSSTWGNYGFSTTPFPGIKGDGLNGLWTNPGNFSNGRCGIDSTDLPRAANYSSFRASFPPQDMGLVIQSSMNIPAGATRNYITETIALPGTNCCQGPNCGTLSGNLSIDAGGCTTGLPAVNHLVVAQEMLSLTKYYGITDGLGNYMINAPFGNYNVYPEWSQNVACTAVLTNNVLNSTTPSITGLNLLLADTCSAEIYIYGSYPGNSIPPNCGIPPLTPCPGDTFQYCFSVLNTGTSPIEGNAKFEYSLPSGVTVIGSMQDPNCWQPFNANFAFLQNPLPPNATCGFCVDVVFPPTATPPWTASMAATNNVDCLNGDDLVVNEALTDTANCSCDPNQKSAYPLGCGPDHNIGLEEITYTLTFHNVGALPAERVVVKDRLDVDFDVSTLKILYSEYPLTDIRVNPIIGSPGEFELVFIYDHIFLAPIALDPQAVGKIIFRITPKAGLTDGTRLENTAEIVFDENPSIFTNSVFHTFKLDPYPTVDAGPDQTIYLGYGAGCTSLSANASGGTPGYTFVWSNGETAPNITVCPTLTTIYSVTVTDAHGCTGVDEVTVTVNDVRCGNNLDKVIVCHNGNEICISASAVATHLSHGDILGNCVSGSSKTQNSSILDDFTSPEMRIFPNPNNGNGQLVFELRQTTSVRISLLDIDGRELEVLFDGYSDGGPQSIPILMDEMPNGIYFCKLQSRTGNSMVKKLIIIH